MAVCTVCDSVFCDHCIEINDAVDFKCPTCFVDQKVENEFEGVTDSEGMNSDSVNKVGVLEGVADSEELNIGSVKRQPVDAPYPHRLIPGRRARERVLAVDTSPVAVIVFRLSGLGLVGSPGHVAWSILSTYLGGDCCLFDVPICFQDDRMRSTVEELIKLLTSKKHQKYVRQLSRELP
ncbi:hypothetical protein MD484_g8680, partial [Candolleomyces efflorescens]